MRLIDSDACPCNTCRTLCCEHPMRCHGFYTWRKNQAYDVERVIEQIEEKTITDALAISYLANAKIAFISKRMALEIIEKGGVE